MQLASTIILQLGAIIFFRRTFCVYMVYISQYISESFNQTFDLTRFLILKKEIKIFPSINVIQRLLYQVKLKLTPSRLWKSEKKNRDRYGQRTKGDQRSSREQSVQVSKTGHKQECSLKHSSVYLYINHKCLIPIPRTSIQSKRSTRFFFGKK